MVKSSIKRVFALVLLSMLLLTTVHQKEVFAANAYVYNTSNLGYNQSIMARTLQAFANQTTAELYYDVPLWNYEQTPQKWMEYYNNTKGYSFTRKNTIITGWSGTKKFEVQVGVQGGTNKSIVIDWLRIGSVTN